MVLFVYTTNGDAFIEHDRTTKSGQIERELPLDAFPSLEELWRRSLITNFAKKGKVCNELEAGLMRSQTDSERRNLWNVVILFNQ